MTTPPLIRRVILVGPSGLTGRYYALTKWRDLGEGRVEAIEKHDVTEHVARIAAKAADDREAEVRARVEAHVRSLGGGCTCGWRYDPNAVDMQGQYLTHLRAALAQTEEPRP